MNVLVVGGAGYIGSHMVNKLDREECIVTVLDDLSTGYKDAVLTSQFVKGDCGGKGVLDELFSNNSFDAVIHFASCIQVGESIHNPAKYYKNNVINTQALLDAMVNYNVFNFIFSSTAAIFGEPQYTPIDENHPKKPVNPYGHSKLMVEQMLSDYGRAYGLRSICLRYFNAAGADPDGKLGERHDPETHLIPLILQAASGRRKKVCVFGTDYKTSDGSCIRDYIHVNDLVEAHWLALEKLSKGAQGMNFNLGNGSGYSVLEVIEKVREVCNVNVSVEYTDRRPGDPDRLVADATKAAVELGWKPKFPDLEDIIKHAWVWEQKRSEWEMEGRND